MLVSNFGNGCPIFKKKLVLFDQEKKFYQPRLFKVFQEPDSGP